MTVNIYESLNDSARFIKTGYDAAYNIYLFTFTNKYQVLKSTDGGNNWTDLNYNNPTYLPGDNNNSVAVGSDGSIYILRNAAYLYLDSFKNGLWTSIPIAPSSTIGSIALDSNNNPHILYDGINYMYYDGNNWFTDESTGFIAGDSFTIGISANDIFMFGRVDNQLYFSVRQSSGVWTNPVLLQDNRKGYYTNQLTSFSLYDFIIEGGDIHLVINDNDSIYYRKFDYQSSTWSAASDVLITNANYNYANPKIALIEQNRPLIYAIDSDTFLLKKEIISMSPIVAWGNKVSVNSAHKIQYDIIKKTINSYMGYLYSQVKYDSSTPYFIKYDSVFCNTKPITPVSLINSSGGTSNKKPKLTFNVSDGQSGIANMQLQLSTTSDFTTLVQDVQFGNDAGYGNTVTGWEGLPTTGVNNTVKVSWTSLTDLSPGLFYVRVRTKDIQGLWSEWGTGSFNLIAIPWSETIPNEATGFKYDWLNQIGTAINNGEAFRNMTVTTFTDGTLTNNIPIKDIHVMERRTALAKLMQEVGISPNWTDSTLTTSYGRKGVHLNELRNYCLQI